MVLRDVGSEQWDEQILRASEPVAVEFWAPWCPWCRRLTPEFEMLCVEYEGRLSAFKLNSDDYPDITQRYGVMGLPTIKLFCQGRVIGELVGYMTRPRLKAELDRALQNRRECLSNSSPVQF